MASTYVNDLRLNEMATGDASGSWGTITNTNLELIGEAFGYGTETIGNADTTITMADGASDAARSFYLKITSSADLTTTRVITLAPNTVSKVWMIENATSGSQIITIKQGTGATINIPNGHVKMVATDGAGSGGAVLDLLTDLNVATNLFVKNAGTGDGSTANIYLQTAEADIAADDVIGKINFQAPNEGTGTDAILVSAAIQAISEGDFSSSSNATSLNFMTGASEAAATKMTLTSGGNLKLITDSAVLSFGADNDTTLTHTDGSGLTLNSTNKIMFNDTSQFIQGSSATVLSIAATDEIDLTATAIDLNGTLDVSGTALVTGVLTTTAATVFNGGFAAVQESTVLIADGQADNEYAFQIKNEESTDDRSFGLLIHAGSTATDRALAINSHDGNAGLFYVQGNGQALFTDGTASLPSITNNGDADTGLYFPAAGKVGIVSQGTESIRFSTSGDIFIQNVGNLSTITGGTSNLRLGVNAGDALNGGNFNVLLGDEAGTAITDGGNNIAIGFRALKSEDNNGNNIAIGSDALENLNVGASGDNVAIGNNVANDLTEGKRNVIIGAIAGDNATTIDDCVIIGYDAGGDAVMTGNANVFIGKDSGRATTSGNENVYVGNNTGEANITGANNVGIGIDALAVDTKGFSGVAVGAFALTSQNFSSSNTDSFNTAVGINAGKFVTTSQNSTFIGANAAKGITSAKLTGNSNTAVGASAGLVLQGAATNNTFVGQASGIATTTGS